MAIPSSKVSKVSRGAAFAAAAVLVVLGFALAGGSRAAWGSALGIALVVLFFAGGRAPMLLARTAPAGPLFLLVAMGYVLRVVLLLAVLISFDHRTWLDRSAVAATIISGALLWTGWLVVRHVTSRQPTLEIPDAAPLTTTGVAQ
jgi:hypothetical protein